MLKNSALGQLLSSSVSTAPQCALGRTVLLAVDQKSVETLSDRVEKLAGGGVDTDTGTFNVQELTWGLSYIAKRLPLQCLCSDTWADRPHQNF